MGDKFVNIDFHCFICDAPARAQLKQVKSHNGYNSCERCTICGDRFNNRTTFFLEGNEEPRTNEKFDRNLYSGLDENSTSLHQTGPSPLQGIVPCVTGFVLDSMHLIYLGIVKRLISYWKQGCTGFKDCKLSAAQIDAISNILLSLRGCLPKELARQTQSLNYSDSWKATELRTFLLYVGPFILKPFLDQRRYKHFVVLSLAVSILSDENAESRNTFLGYSKQLLRFFVETSPALYSKTFVSYNVHSILHVPDDVQHFGCSLNQITCFPFESFLNFLKSLIRGPKNPTQQVVNRLLERDKVAIERTLTISPCTMSDSNPDNCFFLSDNTVVFVPAIQEDCTEAKLVPFVCFNDVFGIGIDSTKFKMGSVRKSVVNRAKIHLISKFEFACKAVCLPIGETFVVIPMHHSM